MHRPLAACTIFLLGFTAVRAPAQSPAVSITPISQTVRMDSVVHTTVHFDSMFRVHAYSIIVAYDVTQLRCQRVSTLSWLGPGAVFFPAIDSANGTVTITESILGPSGKSGSGDVAEIVWIPTRPGSAILDIAKADLRDTTNQKLTANQRGATIVVRLTTGIPGCTILPPFDLLQNFPNPFNPTTQIYYAIEGGTEESRHVVSLRVYDLLGREVATLVQEEQPPGSYTVVFNGKEISSGIYMYRLSSGTWTSTRRMLLAK